MKDNIEYQRAAFFLGKSADRLRYCAENLREFLPRIAVQSEDAEPQLYVNLLEAFAAVQFWTEECGRERGKVIQ